MRTNKTPLSSTLVPLFLILFTTFLLPFTAKALTNKELQIKNVYTNQTFFNPTQAEKAELHFSLSQPALVTVTIYDSLNRAVAALLKDKHLDAGHHQLTWDGLDTHGKPLPQNFYLFTVEAKDTAGKGVRYDPSDITGGKQIGIQNIEYDRNSDQISFTLKQNAILNMRVGMTGGGPMMNTLIDWMPYSAGSHVLKWDGKDQTGNVSLKNIKKLNMNGPAYTLPMNALILQGNQVLKQPVFLTDAEVLNSFRPITRDPKQRIMVNHWQHPRDQCYDPNILLSLPAEQRYNTEGIALVDGPLKLTMDVNKSDKQFMVNQRFEIVCYVDFLFSHEEEMGYLPYYWTWDPKGINNGIHYITIMFRGYEGHFGTTTVKVMVRKKNNEQ